MKKLLALFMLCGALTIGFNSAIYAQDDASGDEAEQPTQTAAVSDDSGAAEEFMVEEETFHQAIKTKFIEGGWQFMSIVLLCLILGLAVAIERIITLNLAPTNTKKLLTNVEDALRSGGWEAAK